MWFKTKVTVPGSALPDEYLPTLEMTREEANQDAYEVDVLVTYDPGYFVPGCRSGHPDNWTPDDGQDPTITGVYLAECVDEPDCSIYHHLDLYDGTFADIHAAATADRSATRELERLAWDDQQARARDCGV